VFIATSVKLIEGQSFYRKWYCKKCCCIANLLRNPRKIAANAASAVGSKLKEQGGQQSQHLETQLKEQSEQLKEQSEQLKEALGIRSRTLCIGY